METVTAILGGGLCVGVFVKGKKIRDDNKTLVQTGIHNDNRADALGFTLEPLSSQVPSPQCPEDHTFVPPEELIRQALYSVYYSICLSLFFGLVDLSSFLITYSYVGFMYKPEHMITGETGKSVVSLLFFF